MPKAQLDNAYEILLDYGYIKPGVSDYDYWKALKTATLDFKEENNLEYFDIVRAEEKELRKKVVPKVKKKTITGAAFKKGTAQEVDDKVQADTTGTSSIVPFKKSPSVDSKSLDSVEDPEEPDLKSPDKDDNKVDQVLKFLKTDLVSKLNEILDGLNGIGESFKEQNEVTEERLEKQRLLMGTAKKRGREKELEKDDPKGESMGEKILKSAAKPVKGFLSTIWKFVSNIIAGAVFSFLLKVVKDPAILLDPIKKFFNSIIGLFNVVVKSLWDISAKPINFVIDGINSGVESLLGAINKAIGLLGLKPIQPPTIPNIPGPPQVPDIPLSKTAQASTVEVKAEGGEVGPAGPAGNEGVSMNQQIMAQTDTTGKFGEDGFTMKRSQATVEQRKEQYKEMGMPSMELWDGSVVPDIGKIGAEKIPAALAQTRQDMVETGASPERIAKLDELIASPDVQPAALQNSLNRLVPGSTEQVLGDLGDDISGSAKEQSKVQTMAGGGGVSVSGENRLLIPKKGEKNPTNFLHPQGFSEGGTVPAQGPGYENSLVQPMAKGGTVDAKKISTKEGGPIKQDSGVSVTGLGPDTQLVAAQPGEVVMSKKAVDHFGRDRLLQMNREGGGTNEKRVTTTDNIQPMVGGGEVGSDGGKGDEGKGKFGGGLMGILKGGAMGLAPPLMLLKPMLNIAESMVEKVIPQMGKAVEGTKNLMLKHPAIGFAKLIFGEEKINSLLGLTSSQSEKSSTSSTSDSVSSISSSLKSSDISPPSTAPKTNVITIPSPPQSSGGGGGSGPTSPSFSSIDSNNLSAIAVRPIYNLTGAS